jgi:hypothetical protein
MATLQASKATGTGRWIAQGVIGGLIAGIVLAIFEMVIAALLMGTSAFFLPLRMAATIVLGQSALDPAYPLVSAALVGVVVHLVLSIIFGTIFGEIVTAVPALHRPGMTLLVAASIFGLALWLVNFYVLAPIFGWNWFPTQAEPVVQFVAHTFFYGTVLGGYLHWSPLPHLRPVPVR